MNTSLLTFDGFPRDDIDVAQSVNVYGQSHGYTNYGAVRITRTRIIHLRNDWKSLMDRIEKAVHNHFAAQNENGHVNDKEDIVPTTSSNSNTIVQQSTNKSREPLQETQPFAKVNSVVVGSPADQAELKAGDEIINFGGVNWLNHEKLSGVARVVQSHQGASISNIPRAILM